MLTPERQERCEALLRAGLEDVQACLLSLAATQPGCLVVGGYSSRGSWFFWPGGLGLLVVVAVVLLLSRRRR
jgi:hypothetical protein